MAEATKVVVKKEVLTVIEEERICLSLSKEEANVVIGCMGRIGGTGPTRRLVDHIYTELMKVGAASHRAAISGSLATTDKD